MIIQSLLDTDLYKFTMMQVVLHHFPGAQVEYKFKCPTEGVDFRPHLEEIREEVNALAALRFRDEELDYLRSLRFIKSDFVDFLALFHFSNKYVRIGRASVPARWTSPSAGRGCTPSCTRSRCSPWSPRCTSGAPNRVRISPKGGGDWRARSTWCARWSASSISASPISARGGASRSPGTRRCCRRSSERCPSSSPALRTCGSP